MVEAPNQEEAREFMDRWHIKGYLGGHWYVGLKNSVGEWAGMASFRNYEHEYELARMAFRNHVSGGISKIIQSFVRSMPEKKPILSYCDLRFGEGGGYIASGFETEGDTNYSYAYANGTGMYHRLKYSKEQMAIDLDWFDSDLTERQNARANGLIRIDGLPQRRFVLNT